MATGVIVPSKANPLMIKQLLPTNLEVTRGILYLDHIIQYVNILQELCEYSLEIMGNPTQQGWYCFAYV